MEVNVRALIRKAANRIYNRASDQPFVVCFVHIPKNGGSTLRSYVIESVGKERVFFLESKRLQEFVALSQAEKARIRCVMGHYPFSYSVHDQLEKPTRYITILRDPVERVLSLYSYISSTKEHKLQSHVVENKIGIEEFVLRKVTTHVENGHIRLLCNVDPDTRGRTACTGEMLEQAKENLENHFEIIGFLDEMDEFYDRLARSFGWKRWSGEKVNVTRERLRKDDLPSHVIELIREQNLLDIELYEHAQFLSRRKGKNNSGTLS